MEKQTIQNLVDYIVLEKLKEHTILDVYEIIDKLTNDLNEDSEIREYIYKSKRYNSIIANDGTQFVFGTKKKEIENAVWELQGGLIRDDEDCWTAWIYCDGESVRLNEFVDWSEV